MRLSKNQSFANFFYLSFLSNKFQALTELAKNSSQQFIAPYRFTVEKNEVCRVPQKSKNIQVLSGAAWVTVAGQDIILESGEKASLSLTNDLAVISALGNVPAIVEVR